ncbi:zinc ribbon domain-containing protein [Marinomonas rhizomae]|uniref:Zinc ribbon protein n=1 Tax=Marinomonas rhizomae TaxID=491948 RepID=A0A366JA86_9GAMM|nr:zinc ribbon domain-containing protein [Marinomonas rhizomae]RBP83946.1 zinc ribbon protein [Marinomonas rhizomae]RNF73355.1 zinc ribbon domain-containing protein [Marinomonas rhizomae]
MFVVILWIAFAILVGLLASTKGRSGFLFFLLALVLSPVIGLIIALVVPKNNEIVESKAIETGGMRKCPNCAELVKSEAKICKHCQSDLNNTVTNEMKIKENKLSKKIDSSTDIDL